MIKDAYGSPLHEGDTVVVNCPDFRMEDAEGVVVKLKENSADFPIGVQARDSNGLLKKLWFCSKEITLTKEPEGDFLFLM